MEKLSSIVQMGWDGHKTFSRVAGRDASGQVVYRARVEHKDRAAMREHLQRWPVGTPVVLEATFGWGWMSDELKAAGLTPRLANCRKVAAWRDSRGLAKSNRLDSELLSELPSQRPPWWEVWLAPPAVRQQRERMRYRMTTVEMQTALKNRIHAVLHRHGILHEYSDLFGVEGRRFLNRLVTEKEEDRRQRGEPTLPDSARATLKGFLQMLDQVRRQIARITCAVKDEVRRSPVARRLRTIPGLGWILAYVILAEIGRIERFKNARHLSSYSLLAPRANDSGEEDPDATPQGRHVGFIGCRTLKWAFIEAAHTAIRRPGRFKDLFDRRTHGGKRDRNRGVIAVAHELARVVYVVWTKEVDYTDNPPPRPGASRTASTSSSRPGTGQPDVAMVPAECSA